MSRPRSVLSLLALLGCGSMSDEAATQSAPMMDREDDARVEFFAEEETAARPKRRSRNKEAKPKLAAAGSAAPSAPERDQMLVGQSVEQDNPRPLIPAEGAKGGEPTKTRAWFPETFLFAPLLVTDAKGEATVSATIPDRLTTWRVLALAHSRDGALGGAVTGLPGRLPVYVDPVVPAFLRAGDTVELPVQAVNTTDTARTARLRLEAEGAVLSGGDATLQLPAGGGAMGQASLRVPQPGTATVRAKLTGNGAEDDVVREIPVHAIGRLVQSRSAGTLGAPRTVELDRPGGPRATDHRVRMVVVPGALAVLEDELLAAAGRTGGSPAAVAHALRLAADGPAVLATLGAPVNPEGDDPESRARAEAIRTLRILATQSALRASRSTDLDLAMVLGPAAARHSGDALLTSLADRMLQGLTQHQRADGSFGGQSNQSWTLQRIIATTAAAAAAAREIAEAPAAEAVQQERALQAQRITIRASAALERYAARIEDPHTAALALLSGALDENTAARLRGLIRAAAVELPSGGAQVAPDGTTLGNSGRRPTALETTALCALALDGDTESAALVSNLSATVLAAWRPGWGWGHGATDIAALRVVTQLLGERPPERVTLSLKRGEQTIYEETIAASELRSVHVVERSIDPAGGAWTLAATPAVPGLGFSLEHRARDPWTDPPTTAGLELVQTVPRRARVGEKAELELVVASTRGAAVSVALHLPAGVQPDAAGLDDRKGSTLLGWEADDEELRLELRTGADGLARVSVPVVPTLAGRLSSGATVLEKTGRQTILAPEQWTVAAR
jgi:hypothetical protein